jgi:hypothetical protein
MTELNYSGPESALVEPRADDAPGDDFPPPAEDILIAGDPQAMALRDDTLAARMAAIGAVAAQQLDVLVRVPQTAIARGKTAWS